MEIKESNLKKWTGTYKGVDFEINNWKTEPNSVEPREQDCWTYYLLLRIERIPEEHKPKSYWLRGRKDRNHVMYDYYKHPVLPNLEWHGGITWYSKEHGFDGSEKIIKVGCDYRHYWDEGKYYDLDIVKRDVERTIDEFLERVPNYKYWCCGNGNLYDLSEGIVRNGSFYSKEYWGDDAVSILEFLNNQDKPKQMKKTIKIVLIVLGIIIAIAVIYIVSVAIAVNDFVLNF